MKVVFTTIWAIMMLALGYWGYLYVDDGARMPSQPEQQTGRVPLMGRIHEPKVQRLAAEQAPGAVGRYRASEDRNGVT